MSDYWLNFVSDAALGLGIVVFVRECLILMIWGKDGGDSETENGD